MPNDQIPNDQRITWAISALGIGHSLVIGHWVFVIFQGVWTMISCRLLKWVVIVAGLAVVAGGHSRLAAQEPGRPKAAPTPSQPESIPADVAVLDLQLPPGTRVIMDDQEIGKQGRATFRSLEPKRWYRPEVTVQFSDGTEVQRKLLVRGGRSIRLAMLGPEAVKREMVLQTGHTSFVESVAFSPDGKYALTGSWDWTAILWDTGTGRQLRTYQGHKDRVTSVAFSPDGQH